MEKDKTFNEVIDNLNKTLKKSESLLHLNHYPKKNDIDSLFPKKEINIIKKMNYYKKWHIKYTLFPVIEKKKYFKKNDDKKPEKSRNSVNYLKGIFSLKHNNNFLRNINKSVEDKNNIPFYLKGFEQKKNNISANEIVKKSILELNKKDHFKKYRYNMEEKVENFVDYKDKYSNYYDFDKKIKKNIKDEKTGITIPGNVLNRNSLGFIRTIQPKNIKLNIKTNVPVPEKALLPVPNGIVGKGLNYTHITIKNVYNEKNKLI
jgi:hypothetical protein